jgi:hypothetical protein
MPVPPRGYAGPAVACVAALLATWCTAAGEPVARHLYEVGTETGMPHLEESLRYAVTRERMCLGGAALATAFPVLRHVALQDCTLGDAQRQGDTITFVLACSGGHGTSGRARWRIDADRIDGTLEVRLGGKNMTFYQRIRGTRVGGCEPRGDSAGAP